MNLGNLLNGFKKNFKSVKTCDQIYDNHMIKLKKKRSVLQLFLLVMSKFDKKRAISNQFYE